MGKWSIWKKRSAPAKSSAVALDPSVFHGFVCTHDGLILEQTFADQRSRSVSKAAFSLHGVIWMPCETPGCGCTDNMLAAMKGVAVREATIRLAATE